MTREEALTRAKYIFEIFCFEARVYKLNKFNQSRVKFLIAQRVTAGLGPLDYHEIAYMLSAAPRSISQLLTLAQSKMGMEKKGKRLTKKEVKAIKESKETNSILVQRYSISRTMVHLIRTGKYKHKGLKNESE